MSRAANLLARLGASCQRSCGLLAEAAAAAGAPSCSYSSIAITAQPAWRPWSLQHSITGQMGLGAASFGEQLWRGFATNPRPSPPDYIVGLGNLRDNPGATRQRIRVGRGNGSRRGNYGGRGMKGMKSRGPGPNILFDGGQLSFLKYPVTRQRPSYEVLYYHLGVSRVVEFVQLGLLDPTRTITMKDLYDSGCVTSNIKYGVLLYGKSRLAIPLDIQVTACDADTRGCVEAAGGRVTRVYYTKEGLGAVMHPEKFTDRRLPLPQPAVRWHPKYDKKFDAIGQIPPAVQPNSAVLALAAASSAATPALAATAVA